VNYFFELSEISTETHNERERERRQMSHPTDREVRVDSSPMEWSEAKGARLGQHRSPQD
jgi:hypothetical protein